MCCAYIETSRTLTFSPHSTYQLNLYGPTDSLDLDLTAINSLLPYSLILSLNGYEVAQCHPIFTLPRHEVSGYYPIPGPTPVLPELSIRLKFADDQQHFKGVQNNDLTDEINQNTLNFSRIESVMISTVNCKLTSCLQNRYDIYQYPSRRPKYVY